MFVEIIFYAWTTNYVIFAGFRPVCEPLIVRRHSTRRVIRLRVLCTFSGATVSPSFRPSFGSFVFDAPRPRPRRGISSGAARSTDMENGTPVDERNRENAVCRTDFGNVSAVGKFEPGETGRDRKNMRLRESKMSRRIRCAALTRESLDWTRLKNYRVIQREIWP